MKYKISNIAIYLRKSRGDEDVDVLKKHRKRLIEYSDQNGWKYDIFEEVASGERISNRPEIQKLLILVEKGMYDGVLVVDYDRLSRGNNREFGEIIDVFQYSSTLIITQDRIYDVNNNNDLTLLGIQGVLSNAELRRITDRLLKGKKDGVRDGKLTNGKPPYPYEYQKQITLTEDGKERVIGKVVVNKEKADVYKEIKKMYLSGRYGTEAIAVHLNNKGIISPGGSVWHNNAVKRLLVHQFHMGKIIYGKNEWKRDRDNKRKITRKRDESEWVIGEGDYENLKTQEEHKRILQLLEKNNKIPRKSRMGCFPTSGVMYCKKCGRRMAYSVGRREVKSGKIYNYTKCSYKTPLGEKCSQKGIKMDEDFYECLYQSIVNYININELEIINENKEIINERKKLLVYKQEKLKELQKSLFRIMEAYELGVYSIEEFQERKKEKDKQIKQIKNEVVFLSNESEKTKKYTKDELKEKIQEFKDRWKETCNSKEQNMLLKTIVKKIIYDRNGDSVSLEVEYL
ncbi:recombinase family protein [Tepidibacter hydrothermalis]|uniref:Recombinase family protein n=1 Tax=Tepidibacter hydrothermalis TaxID=3036126 RepID=A0ABY8EEE5_9FIRM|nr:recombinase family protein [Tepidibacter hydrothermalis]WFD11317.1 recombinase family protein [Tepidibacter hydrothermalis]